MAILESLHRVIWGAPALVLILGVGLLLSIALGFPQLTLFPRACGLFWQQLRGKGAKDSPFQALCTALAATVGTGNLVGVAGAICLGGPGSIFWMWVSGILGMATKYAEVTLALRYRVRQADGHTGGPMYVITGGLGRRALPLAKLYCLLGLLASFGVGNATQISAVLAGIHGMLGAPSGQGTMPGDLLVGLGLAVLVGVTLLGGAQRIGRAAQTLVPAMSVGYLVLCAGALAVNGKRIPRALAAIGAGILCPRAVTGGALSSAFAALRIGCSRGVFTNEAGMGTASIAHAAAQVDHPAEQGLMGVMEVFLDTLVICTLTALVILTSGIPIPYGRDAGSALTEAAFAGVYGRFSRGFLAVALCTFAFATVLGWSLYGGRCAQFLFGPGAWRWYCLAQMAVVVLSTLVDAPRLWLGAEILNGLMAIPNLLALALLMPQARQLTREYREKKSASAPRLRRHLPEDGGILGAIPERSTKE